MNLTIDASVWVAAAQPHEPQFASSLRFLDMVERQGERVFCPTLVLPECSAAIARPTGNERLAQETVLLIQQFPNLSLVALSPELAERASRIAAEFRLRGADAVYTAVAEQENSTLVSWDGEMVQRGGRLVPSLTPDDWLASLAS